MKIQSFAAVAALASTVPGAVATFDWHKAPIFSCPIKTPEICVPEQHGGFNWLDLITGPVDIYGGFKFEGFTCKDSFAGRKRDALLPRTFGPKCISGQASHVKSNCPKVIASTVDKFSITELQISVEFDVDLEFHYTLPDLSICKQKSHCKKSGSVVKNTQCGGAKDVVIVLPKPPTGSIKASCSIGIHSVGFHCPSSTAVPVQSTTIPSVPEISASVSLSVGIPSVPEITGSASLSIPSVPEITGSASLSIPSVPEITASVPGSIPSGPSVPDVNVSVPVSVGSSVPEFTPSATLPSVPEITGSVPVGIPTLPSLPDINVSVPVSIGKPPFGSTSENVPVASTTEAPPATITTVIVEETVTTCPVTNTHVTSGVTSVETTLTVSTISITTTKTFCPECTEGPHGPTSTPSVPETIPAGPETTPAGPETTPGPISSISDNSPFSNSTAPPAVTMTTVIVSETVTTCPVTNTHVSSGVTSIETTLTVSTISLTTTKTYCPGCTKSTGPPYPTATPVTSTSANSPVQSEIPETPCPPVLPQCLNTWLPENCSSNSDTACYCPSPDFTSKIFECLTAYGASQAEINSATQYFQGICAPYIPTNPGLIIDAPQCNSTQPGPVTTIILETTITASSTVQTISTQVTVPQVILTTGTGSTVNLVPGTAPQTVSATATLPQQTPTSFVAIPTPAVPTSAAIPAPAVPTSFAAIPTPAVPTSFAAIPTPAFPTGAGPTAVAPPTPVGTGGSVGTGTINPPAKFTAAANRGSVGAGVLGAAMAFAMFVV